MFKSVELQQAKDKLKSSMKEAQWVDGAILYNAKALSNTKDPDKRVQIRQKLTDLIQQQIFMEGTEIPSLKAHLKNLQEGKDA
jgi:hypothetical protein